MICIVHCLLQLFTMGSFLLFSKYPILKLFLFILGLRHRKMLGSSVKKNPVCQVTGGTKVCNWALGNPVSLPSINNPNGPYLHSHISGLKIITENMSRFQAKVTKSYVPLKNKKHLVKAPTVVFKYIISNVLLDLESQL